VVLAPNPLSRLMQELDQTSAGKLRYIPSAVHPRVVLPLLATAVSVVGVFIRMDLPRVFLLLSLSTLILLAPFAISFAAHGIWQRMSYLAMCFMPLGLWVLSRFERAEAAVCEHEPEFVAKL
jgi:hypothetical protein